MDKIVGFSYTYSAAANKEVQEIRQKYLPREESKFEELKRLDSTVQNSGMMESLCTGIGGVLIFGLGMCLTTQMIGSGVFLIVTGVLLSIIGMSGILVAYPVYRKVYEKTKQKLAPRIFELTAALSDERI